jgi:hypothetical protein
MRLNIAGITALSSKMPTIASYRLWRIRTFAERNGSSASGSPVSFEILRHSDSVGGQTSA